jgi:hypothetical protein
MCVCVCVYVCVCVCVFVCVCVCVGQQPIFGQVQIIASDTLQQRKYPGTKLNPNPKP